MTRMTVLLVSLLACINLVGCSKGPSNRNASKLALNYLSRIIPGITEKEIIISGTLEMGDNTVVIVQAGGMYCDMPVIKSEGRWAAKNISCYGQFESAEKAVVRLQNTARSHLKTKVDSINSKLLYTIDNDVMYNKHEFANDTAVYYLTLLDTKNIDCTNELISSKLKPLIHSLCSDYDTHKGYFYYDVSYDYSYHDSNGKLTSKHITNEDICDKLYLCQMARLH